MVTANRPLNHQALALEEAETKIRILVRDEYLKRTPRDVMDKKARWIIEDALKIIKIVDLKRVGFISLMRFYNAQMRDISRIRGQNLLIVIALMRLNDKENKIAKNVPVFHSKSIVRKAIQDFNAMYGTSYDDAKLTGVPLQKFNKAYMDKYVKPTLDRLSKSYALDPDDITGRNSLRNKAEMEVRYQANIDSIDALKQQGYELVIASSHADCSERCREFQGRVYSLNGTSGTTPDGRKFVPLEEATDIYYTTKAGRTYKNGLLGFNCRHYLVPYKDGFRFPKPDPKIEAKEYKITQKQRYLERQIRHWRTEAITNKGIYPEYAQISRNTAIYYNKEYIEYSKKNKRAYYPSRTKLI